ncbi:hypothetical protein [Vibrio sp. VB16]|uniref:hypothetical protein n=1 Tax=Vibrio sp. VB16 TaxID=2785746 RepID=UPI0018A0EC3D|nr:hypothetical protein [Vibrio sp. VB16]UGA55299.1 hypothetical protein IUZ65_002805 [Vibrio sp. VB16]
MSNKNPKHGYIRCFSCGEPSTVHIMGEAKLLEMGEPPKNKRNTGRYYYVCPKCGTSQPKNSQERIQAALVEDVNQLPPIEISTEKPLPVEVTKPSTDLTVIEQKYKTVKSVANEPEPTKSKSTLLWVGGAAALVLVFVLINVFPKGGHNE